VVRPVGVLARVGQVLADGAGVVGVEVVAQLVLVSETQLALGALVNGHAGSVAPRTLGRVLVRRALPSDDPVVRHVHVAAFGREVEAGIYDALRADGDLIPALCFVAEAGHTVVGHVAVSTAHVGSVAVPAIGPVGVLPGRQRQGAGSALLHAVVGGAEALGEQCLVLLGSTAYYTRFGFGPAGDIVPPDPAWGEHFQVRRLTAWDGSIAGPFRYAPAFSLDA
jgi:putative acetyltransferase